MRGYAIQRSVRQSPRKMRLVMDLIRGKNVNEAYAILQFNKKLAAKQIAKTLKSAVASVLRSVSSTTNAAKAVPESSMLGPSSRKRRKLPRSKLALA